MAHQRVGGRTVADYSIAEAPISRPANFRQQALEIVARSADLRSVSVLTTKTQDCRPTRRRVRDLALLAGILLALTDCALPTRLTAVPQGETRLAQIAGIPNERYFPDQIDLLAQEFLAARGREAVALAQQGYSGPLP